MDFNKLNATVANNLSTLAAIAIDDKEIAKAQKVHPKYLKKALKQIWKSVVAGKTSAYYQGNTDVLFWTIYFSSWDGRVAEYVKYSLENLGFKVDITEGSVAYDFGAYHVPALEIKW